MATWSDAAGKARNSSAGHQCELSTYFAGPYLRGELLEAAHYSEGKFGEDGTFCFDAPDGKVQVWQFAFDLRELAPEDKEVVVLYHYCAELAFRNVSNMEQSSAELFASLVEKRAHFGQGVYATQHEPAAWGSRARLLLNNYSNGSPFRAGKDEEERVREEWGDRAAFCIPMVVPVSMAYNIFERQTPDLARRHVALGEDYKGRPVDRDRDVWVVRIADEGGQVRNAAASADGLLRLLETRLSLLRQRPDAMSNARSLQTMHFLARRLDGRGQHQEAERLYRECLCKRRAVLGDRHPNTLSSVNNLAFVLMDQGKLQEAEALFRENLDARRAALGDRHPDTLTSVSNLAGVLMDQGSLQEAEALHREALDGSRQTLGDLHPDTLTSIFNLAGLLKKTGQLAEAEALFREELEGCRQTLGETHEDTLSSAANLAELLEAHQSLLTRVVGTVAVEPVLARR